MTVTILLFYNIILTQKQLYIHQVAKLRTKILKSANLQTLIKLKQLKDN